MSYLVANPEDRFSRDEALFVITENELIDPKNMHYDEVRGDF